MYKILILEDDELFAQTLEDFLEEENFEVDIANDGEEALELNYNNNYDLYLLDINVPKLNGLELLKELRGSGDETATIFLTSYKDKDTLEQGFLSGCDDYIKKPVDLDELLLRIKSILKRCGKVIESIKLKEDLIFNPITKRVYQDGKDLNIPIKIVSLLELFLENKESIITKEMIISKLWSVSEEYSEGSIRVYINNLKKILGKDSITNIKGIGYKIEF
ncbi:response regulator transcription factor [Malaciobacter mytili]|uniref:DNA-binding response regulator n=1 Tax=Malaciobacter mytili LMG 24559 TaxID=1032238 RepID=A0AAX2AFG5_9BACT|nr:response regulator transcription factor [Malaciobacter mytili]AXH15155.1 two-component system response regulator [Malaciobacter mytili LMG 24559]RXI44364.1 DNA-binding response regulator [Malaciobacter mytili]RXK14763.1 DNA-binding response regulator [Malaciobacter mytili LMG 24559]